MKNIVSFSGGKDSTAMLHLLISQGVKIDKVIYFETEWDFPQMAYHLKLVAKKTDLQIVKVRYYRHFNEQLAAYGWPRAAGGWCVACKHHTCLRAVRHLVSCKNEEKVEYVGFSLDEVKRTRTKWMKTRKWQVNFPLVEAGMSGADNLEYCKKLGYHWDGLYDVFSRVSCFCCPKGGKAKRRLTEEHYPKLAAEWRRLDTIALKHQPF